MKNFLKNNYMKLIACLIWIFGIAMSIAYGLERTNSQNNFLDVLIWTILFLAIGFIAFLLACIYHLDKRESEGLSFENEN